MDAGANGCAGEIAGLKLVKVEIYQIVTFGS